MFTITFQRLPRGRPHHCPSHSNLKPVSFLDCVNYKWIDGFSWAEPGSLTPCAHGVNGGTLHSSLMGT